MFGLVSPFTSSEPEVSVVLQDVTFFQERFGWVNVHMSGSGRRDPSPSSKLLIARPPLRNLTQDSEGGQGAGKSVAFFCSLE